MNTMMLAFIGIAEVFVILLVLLGIAGLAVGLVLLTVWLVRRGLGPASAPPASRFEGEPSVVRPARLSFFESLGGRVQMRWRIYALGLGLVLVISSLINGLLLAAGVWSGVDTVLFGLLAGAVIFNVIVIYDFNRAVKAASLNPPATGNPPPTGNSHPPSPTPSASCPRCGAPLPPHSPQGLCPPCVMGVGLAAQTEAPGELGPHGTRITKPAPTLEELAVRFPHLEILECLGRGGMGVVYKARQPKLNRLIALKILAPEKGADPKFAERFQREAQALARLSHPNIVTVHDFGEADGMFFLIMEHVDGMTLRHLLREGHLKPEEALAIVPKVCEALQFAHEQGIVHRDIKPENVLLDKQGRVKIADFGIAKILGGTPPAPSLPPSDGERTAARPGEGSLTQDQILGTPHYMAPEQVEKPQSVDHRADIYSLGVVFYEMLTGELPLGKFQPPSRKVQVDVRLDDVVLHALEREPERRYQLASEVKTDVETIAAGAAKSEVRPVLRSSTAEGGTPKSDAGRSNAPQFSRTAIWGAIWAPFGLVGALLYLLLSVPTDTAPGLPWLILLFALPLGLLGLTAPFGSTILGWVAISRIRQSRGRLYGLGLAVFDGLFYPLLVLDALVAVLFKFLGAAIVYGFGLPSNTRLTVLLVVMVLAIVALDWWIIRTVWRAVNPPADASSPRASVASDWKKALAICAAIVVLVVSLPPLVTYLSLAAIRIVEKTPASPAVVVAVEEKLRNEIERRLSQDGWKAEGLSVSVAPDLKRADCRFGRLWKGGLTQEPPFRAAILLEALVGELWQVRGEGEFLSLRFSVDCSTEMAAATSVLPRSRASEELGPLALIAAQFNPEIEVTLNDVDDYRGSELLDLDVGRTLDLDREFEKWPSNQAAQWLKARGIDLMVDHVNQQWGLITPWGDATRLVLVTNAFWDGLGQTEFERELNRTDAGLQTLNRGGIMVYLLAANATPPLTFAFVTPGGSRGLLQASAWAENPNQFKLRFKLARGETAAGANSRTTPLVPDSVVILRDNMALDVDTGALQETRNEPTRAQLVTLDVAWDNDGGGVLMRNPAGKSKLLPLPDAASFEEAADQARERRSLVAGSEHRGEFASRCRFFGMLTDQARLAVIEAKDFDHMQATVRWRLLDNLKTVQGQ